MPLYVSKKSVDNLYRISVVTGTSRRSLILGREKKLYCGRKITWHVAVFFFMFFNFIMNTTTMDKNNEKNDKFYRKVAFLNMYTEMVNFRPQS